jgi:hypothetical protein
MRRLVAFSVIFLVVFSLPCVACAMRDVTTLVAEPGTIIMLGLGLIGIGIFLGFRKK